MKDRLAQLGCAWKGDYCTLTVDGVAVRARIDTGSEDTLQLWPAS